MAERQDLAVEVSELNVEQLLERLKDETRKVSELSESLEKESVPSPQDAEQLIHSIAANVASMREAAGLPSEGAGQVVERIRRQSELS